MKNNKGITLIALVVTIIVLLILAGVSIAMLTGKNGILTQAISAKESSTVKTLDEATKIAVGNIMTTNLGWPYEDTQEATFTKALKDEIEGISGSITNVKLEKDGDGTLYKITATVDKDIRTVHIDKATGAVTE